VSQTSSNRSARLNCLEPMKKIRPLHDLVSDRIAGHPAQ
jgi:hypothetical protein